jgi:hypothetical protein
MPDSSPTVPHETPILSAPFQPQDRWLLWPRIRLYVDRLELTQWWGWRSAWREVPLDRLARVEALGPETLRIRPRDHEPLALEIEDARRWARVIRAFRACADPPD